MKTRLWSVCALVLSLAFFSGCAKPPAEAIEAARQALESAKAAQASEYAPRSLANAETAKSTLEAELKAQEDKFALFRSYKKATEMATAAKAAADQTVQDANTAKEQARRESEALIGQVRAAIDEAKQMLASAPRGKGSQMDIKALEADIASTEASLAEVERTYGEGAYLRAKAKAQATLQSVNNIKSTITAAIEMRKQAMGQR
ncbi:MAG: hypothetical protein FJY75_09530 [Candidatus Eisenbacteria bacterium]|uniref:DUF4398 domain-containing protein n=1 Tax=Eiseniibacteriota bacterium TaxID=2212470 RepID=A0A938BP86_UNCEI|nr:hypothetical protein [Candidatus Eisenbacteria bacterium]